MAKLPVKARQSLDTLARGQFNAMQSNVDGAWILALREAGVADEVIYGAVLRADHFYKEVTSLR